MLAIIAVSGRIGEKSLRKEKGFGGINGYWLGILRILFLMKKSGKEG